MAEGGMVVRILALAGGVAGAVALSQFPEFSQQYLQRLAGNVDALGRVAAEFDASAAQAGLDRESALASMTGTAFAGLHQSDMRAAFARLARLQSDLVLLREAGPVERVFLPQRFMDAETLAATWRDYRAAVPATTSGLATAALGYVGGWAAVLGVLSLLAAPFRRRRPARG
jgi:hypothetical protein